MTGRVRTTPVVLVVVACGNASVAHPRATSCPAAPEANTSFALTDRSFNGPRLVRMTAMVDGTAYERNYDDQSKPDVHIDVYTGMLALGSHDVSLTLTYRGHNNSALPGTDDYMFVVRSAQAFVVDAGERVTIDAVASAYDPQGDGQSGIKWRVETTMECSAH